MTTSVVGVAWPALLRRRPEHRVRGPAIHGWLGGVMGTEPTTEDLVRRTAQNDRDAFSRLYDEVAPMVYGVALRVVRDPARAEEISQEVFLQVWDRAAGFDLTKGSARSWIAAIAHHRAVDAVRSEEALRRRTMEVGARSLDTAFDVVADTVERSEDSIRVRDALDHLTPLQKQAVDLAYFGGMTYREVAEKLDSPLGTIKTRMRSALITLGGVLGGGNG